MFCDDVINLTHTSCLCLTFSSTQTWFLHMFFSLHFSMHNHDPKIKMTSFTSKNFITSHNIQFYSRHKIQQIFPVPIGNPLINSYWRCCMHIDKLRSITISLKYFLAKEFTQHFSTRHNTPHGKVIKVKN